jgi:hypothetical protein
MIPATESTARKGVGRSSVAITGAWYRWPNAVMPYVIDPTIVDPGRIELAISLTLNVAPKTTGVGRTAQVSIGGNTVVVTQAAI